MPVEHSVEPLAQPLDRRADAILDLTQHGTRDVFGGDAFAVEPKGGIEHGQARVRVERDPLGIGGSLENHYRPLAQIGADPSSSIYLGATREFADAGINKLVAWMQREGIAV